MNPIFFIPLIILSLVFLYLFLREREHNPLWLMLFTWSVGLGIAQLNLSSLEKTWDKEYWLLILASLISFTLGYFVFKKLFEKYPWWRRIQFLNRLEITDSRLKLVIYALTGISIVALWMYYTRSGNFSLLASNPDEFRFIADEQVPGLINYSAQLSRIFIPLSFFLMFYEGFSIRKHWDLVLISVLGTICISLFASRTQIFFIDLWIMALYLLMRRPTLKQALKFYPIFLLVSILVLTAVPLYRQYKSYGDDYLGTITGIDTTHYNKPQKFMVPIYVGVSFNQQSLLHATEYYQTHPIQKGRVTLDPFTNIVGLDQLKSNYDLCQIFQCWWNTGTYLFPFVQDFGKAAFFFVPFIISGILTMIWLYWKTSPNFLSTNLYAYACFFIVMTIYLSFTVRAEMYIDLFVLFICYLLVSKLNLQKL